MNGIVQETILFFVSTFFVFLGMINDRIAFLIHALNLNTHSFADKIGVSHTVLYNVVKGRRSKPSYDLLLKILSAFSQINTEWLLTGEGTNWFHDTSRKVPPHLLEEKVRQLSDHIAGDTTASLEAQELVELVKSLLVELKEKQRLSELLIRQNDEIMAILKDRLDLDI